MSRKGGQVIDVRRQERDAERIDRWGRTKKDREMARKRRLRTIVISVVLFLLLATFLLIYLPRVKTYEIIGLTTIEASELLQQSGLEKNTHIFKLNLNDAKTAIEQNPYVKVDDIEYQFPDSVRITVTERSDDACIRFVGQDAVISRDGTVLQIGEANAFPGILRLQGVNVTGYMVGQPLGVQDAYQLRVITQVLEYLYQSDYRNDFDVVDLSNPVDIRLLSKNQVTVRVGQIEDMDSKLYRVSRVLRLLVSEGRTGGILDASTDTLSYREVEEGNVLVIPPESNAPELIYDENGRIVVPGADAATDAEGNLGDGTTDSESGLSDSSGSTGGSGATQSNDGTSQSGNDSEAFTQEESAIEVFPDFGEDDAVDEADDTQTQGTELPNVEEIE